MSIAPAPRLAAPLVLVAEDDDEMRILLERALRRDGYEVFAARDAAGVLGYVVASRTVGRDPDLIVSDLRMPRVDGLELVRRLRAHGSAAKVVLVSGFADEPVERAARALGIAYVLSKPFDLDDLRTVVMYQLRR